MTSTPRDHFRELAARPDDQIDLDEAALWIAAEAYPDLDVDAYLARLDALAQGARVEVLAAIDEPGRADALLHFLAREGFTGNHEDYADPRNSFLNEVLDRRTGIPISLSVVYIEVARRLGLSVCGVGFPGHFLAKHEGKTPVVVDPFHGRVLGHEDCVERLHAVAGDRIEFAPHMLDASPRHEILARMLRNLKQHYLAAQEFEPALACSERIVCLLPDVADEIRDRGLIYLRLECFGPALGDLERYVELVPGDRAARSIRARLPELRQRAAEIH